ncbi:MAG: sugar-binding transcriptional regulator [Actinomycetes bacterium]|jgi:DNA-binding transcriptional regulator LsrR (DeoR family)
MRVENEGERLSTWSSEQLRLITKIAVLYHEEGMGQADISKKLNLSQARVSRYLKAAEGEGIVRTTVVQPFGIYVGLEKALEQKFKLQEVVVVENIEGASLVASLGSAAATYLETTLVASDHVGISSWSTTLLATVEAMRSRPRKVVNEVVQLIGGVGSPQAQIQASRLTSHLAELTSATPFYMAAPGVASSKEVKKAFLSDPAVRATIEAWGRVTTLLVGVGTFPASPLLAASGNALEKSEEQELAKAGAVGEICLRYFNGEGNVMSPEIEERVISMDAKTMKQIPRRIGVAGGAKKLAAIRAAVEGSWINVLITDSEIARQLLEPPRQKRK